jgi:transposase-like protein
MEKENKQKRCKKVLCPNCSSANTIKWCKRKTQNRGLIQRYKCKSCNFYFTLDDGFYRMRNTPQKVTQAVDLFYRGVSTRKVQEHLAIFHLHNANNSTVYRWVVKYSKMISKFTEKLKVNVGSEVQVDEMECHRRKSHKKGQKGIEKNWFIDSIDPETKFLISSDFSRTRASRDIKPVVKRIKDKTENQIQIVTTDGLNAYSKIIKKTWGYNNKLGRHNVFHNKVIASNDEGFNYPIERLHNSVRARTKVMRGFHGSIHSANAILKGFEVYYNFITKHQVIKKCPYELAIPELAETLKDTKNRWLGLIYLTKEASL